MKALLLILSASILFLCVGCEAVQGYSASLKTKYGNVSYSNDGKQVLR